MTKGSTYTTWGFTLLLTVLLTVSSLTVWAQQQTIPVYDQTGAASCVVVVDSIRLSRSANAQHALGDSTQQYTVGLFLLMSLKGKPLQKEEQLTLLPRLFTETDSVDLPPIGPMNPMSPITLPYSQHTPYQPWMEQAQLKLIVSRSDGKGGECRQSSCIIGEKQMILSQREVRSQSTTSDIQQLQGHAYISFAVNKTDIRPELGRNRHELRVLHSILDSLRNVEKMHIRHLSLKGFSSPEGSYAHNEQLSQGRVESLRQYIVSHYNLSSDIISTDWEAEDWQGLRKWVEASRLADKEQILTIIDSDEDPDRKLALILQRHPAAYRQMNAEAFPLLRHTDYSIDYSITKDSHHENVQMVTDTTYIYRIPLYDEPLRPVITYTVPTEVEKTPLLAVKTNLLMDFAYMPGYDRWCPMPNVAIEYYPKKGHFTFGASFDMPWWQDYEAHKYFQFRNYQLETRWYLKAHKANGAHGANKPKKPFSGFFVQGYAHLAIFGICFDENRGWVGEGIGGGVGAGYVLPLSRKGRWNLEMGVQVGMFRCKYDPYQYENPVNPSYRDGLYYYKWTGKPELFKERQYRWNWLGPTRASITLSYDLLRRTQGERRNQ